MHPDRLPFDSQYDEGPAHDASSGCVAGAVAGGGLTVIANAPNPAGFGILKSSFDGGINPMKLLMGAAIPTIVACICFQVLV